MLKTFSGKKPKPPKSSEPEAEPTDIYGQYLFANDRKDIEAREENTPEEDSVGGDFIDYYENNKKKELAKQVPALLKLLQAGKYKKLLAPPNKPVYRGIVIEKAKIVRLLKKLGLQSLEDAYNEHGDETPARTIATPGKIRPVNEPIQGWSLMLSVAREFAEPKHIDSKYMPVIFVANPYTKGNRFVINPLVQKTLEPDVSDEFETISYGPVTYDMIYLPPVVANYTATNYVFTMQWLRKMGY